MNRPHEAPMPEPLAFFSDMANIWNVVAGR